jgi:hypothetical protein
VSCIFCNIIARTAEALIIHEDDRNRQLLGAARFANDGYRTWPTISGDGQTREAMHARFRLELD